MTIIQRSYTGQADRQLMSNLVLAFPDNNFHVVDLPYRLCSPSFEDERNIRLWENANGQLLAFAVWQIPFAVLDYAIHPHAQVQDIETQLLTWAISRFQELARERGRRLDYYIDVREDQADRIQLLEQHGFTPDNWGNLHMQRPLTTSIPDPHLPPGFTIRPLAGESEVEAYVTLHRAAFESTSMTVDWRHRTLQAPEYIPDIDLVVQAPDGRLAAFCICWLHPHLHTSEGHKEGQVEPMGVHPDFQRLGLGQAILLENLRRMQARGAETSHVESYTFSEPAQQLYQSVGFQITHKVLKYSREF